VVGLFAITGSRSADKSVAALSNSTAFLPMHEAAGSLRSCSVPFLTSASAPFALRVLHAAVFRIATLLGHTNTLGNSDLIILVAVFISIVVVVVISESRLPSLVRHQALISQRFWITGTSAIDAGKVESLDLALGIPTALRSIEFLGLTISE
jgi:hypothetical protein